MTNERSQLAAAEVLRVSDRACTLVSRKLQPLGSHFATGMTGLLLSRRPLWVVIRLKEFSGVPSITSRSLCHRSELAGTQVAKMLGNYSPFSAHWCHIWHQGIRKNRRAVM